MRDHASKKAAVDPIVFKISVQCPRTGCDGNVTVPVMFGGYYLSDQEKSNTYGDSSVKRGVCDVCRKMAEVSTTMVTKAKRKDQAAASTS